MVAVWPCGYAFFSSFNQQAWVRTPGVDSLPLYVVFKVFICSYLITLVTIQQEKHLGKTDNKQFFFRKCNRLDSTWLECFTLDLASIDSYAAGHCTLLIGNTHFKQGDTPLDIFH